MRRDGSLLPTGRGLLIALVLAVATSWPAQAATRASVPGHCEASQPVREALARAGDVGDEHTPPGRLREMRRQALQAILREHPDDFFVHRRYQDSFLYGPDTGRDEVQNSYRERLDQRPEDAASTYLYARLLLGVRTEEAKDLLHERSGRDPPFLGPTWRWRASMSPPGTAIRAKPGSIAKPLLEPVPPASQVLRA